MNVALLAASVLALTPSVLPAQVERGDPLPRKGVFGAQLAPLTPDEAKAAGVEAGVKVVRVLPGLTAEALKLQEGDVVVQIAGKPVAGAAAIGTAVRALMAGKPLEIEYYRGGRRAKATAPLAERPRQKPDGFEVHYDQFVSQGKRIRLIATHPKAPGRHPTVFLIGGIGAYSVDGDFGGVLYGNVLAPIANDGYATIRIDKPGQGDSEGPVYTELGFGVELDAYRQGIRLAKTLPFVDPDRIAILGHSMGGAFGPLAASTERVAGVIAAGTMSKTWTEYMLENSRRQAFLGGAQAADVDAQMKRLAQVCYWLFEKGVSIEEAKKQAPDLAGAIAELSPDGKTFSGVGLPFFQELARANLAEAWSKVDAKVLTLWGENEFISTRADHEYIAEWVNARRPGTAEFQVIPQSDHGFFKTTSTKDSAAKWGRPGAEFNPNVVDILKAWLGKTLKA